MIFLIFLASWNLDDSQLVTIIVASCTSVAVALLVVISVLSCYWCFSRSKRQAQCQTCYLRASLVDVQSFLSTKVSAENLHGRSPPPSAERTALLGTKQQVNRQRNSFEVGQFLNHFPSRANGLDEEAPLNNAMDNCRQKGNPLLYTPLLMTKPASAPVILPSSVPKLITELLPGIADPVPTIQLDGVWTESTV